MSLSDPIADMLTRIRNGGRVGKEQVKIKASKVCEGIARVLQEEGYIESYDRIDDGNQGFLRIFLKYSQLGDHVITDLQRVSKPGRRIYSAKNDMPEVLDGLGVMVVSTSKGVISDRKCRQENIGGELICTVK